MPKVDFDVNYTQEDAKRYRKLALQYKRKCELMEGRLTAYENKVRDLRQAISSLKISLKREMDKNAK